MRLAEPLEGLAFGLRSPEGDDARFTVALRTDPDVSRFLNRIPGDLPSQRGWEREALAREDDLPLVIFRRTTGAAEGTVGIYRINPATGTAEWGRWALRRGSIAAVESALLTFQLAFDVLALHSLYCRTLTGNVRTVSFHDSAGLERTSSGTVAVNGRAETYIEHLVDSERWPGIRARLQPLAERVARRLQ